MVGNETGVGDEWGYLSTSCLHVIGKKSGAVGMPLIVHMVDSASIAEYLWDFWLSKSCKSAIMSELKVNDEDVDESITRCLLIFLCSVHDVGKATPEFQSYLGNASIMTEHALSTKESYEDHLRHEMVSERILERNGFSHSIALIVGGHHGITYSKSEVEGLDDYPGYTGFKDKGWVSVQDEILRLCIRLSGLNVPGGEVSAGIVAQTLLSGLVIMADWLASNEKIFPILNEYDSHSLKERSLNAIKMIHFPKPWIPGSNRQFIDDFGHEPRQFQADVGEICRSEEGIGIMIMEVPMGEGKTEAALYASEIISGKCGHSGIMFSMPTQATSDGLFPRIEGWIRKITDDDPISHTIFLAHGRSQFNKDYRQLDRIGFGGSGSCTGPVVNDWFSGSKKGLLSDFVIGTVDNVLMMGLGQKHLVLRHLALSQKIVIVDECHTYDAYMSSYLDLALSWLGRYHVPIIILSATLSSDRRKGLIASYMKGMYGRKKQLDMSALSDGYPAITYSVGDSIRQRFPVTSRKTMQIRIQRTDPRGLVQLIAGLSSYGGIIGVVLNTVSKAQETYSQLVGMVPDCRIIPIHSAFTSSDRSEKESEIMSKASGRRDPLGNATVVIGTQVIEQSLDLDFDLLITDICPVDLLIQRMGRLHRHDNPRPESFMTPTCVILDDPEGGLDPGSEAVYGKFHLLNTRRLIGDSILIPDDISNLVERAYSQSEAESIAVHDEDYRNAKYENDLKVSKLKKRSESFQIPSPDNIRNISGWVRNPIVNQSDELIGMASVRDMEESIEVVLLQKRSDGLHFLPWIRDGEMVDPDDFDDEVAFDLAGCTIRLSHRLTVGDRLGRVIRELEGRASDVPGILMRITRNSDRMILALDEDLMTELIGFKLRYSRDRGLEIVG